MSGDIMAQRSDAYAKYLTRTDKTFMTMEEATALSRDLADEIIAADGCPDLLVGLANGALLPTKVAADRLRTPFEIMHVRRRGSRYKQMLFAAKDALGIPNGVMTWPPLMVLWRFVQERTSKLEHTDAGLTFDVRGKYVVVVDDAIQTGRSARYVVDLLVRGGALKVKVAVLCWYKGPDDSGDWAPEIYLHRKDQYYPWSNNSPYLKAFQAWLPANGLKFWR